MPTFAQLASADRASVRTLLVRYLRIADLNDVQALLLWSKTEPFPLGSMVDLVLLRGIELDSEGLIDWLGRTRELAHFTSDARQLRAMVERPQADDGAGKWERELVEQSRHNREEALARARRLEASDAKAANSALRAVLSDWAASDPRAAWEWLGEQEGLAEFSQLAHMLVRATAKQSPLAAREMLAALPAGTTRVKLAAEIVSMQAKLDFQGAVDAVLAEPDSGLRNYLFERVSTQLLAQGDEKFLQLMREHGIAAGLGSVDEYRMDGEGMSWHGSAGGKTRQSVESAASKLALQDPARALAYLGVLSPESWSGMQNIAAQWAKKDAPAALTWVTGLPPGEFREIVQKRMIESWAQDSPVEAAEFISQDPSASGDRGLVLALVNRWAATDSEAALRWSLGASLEALPAALGAIARFSPQQAAAEIGALATPERRQEGIGEIAGHWRKSDAGATVEWLDSLPAEDNVLLPIHAAAKEWAEETPNEASAWIGAMEAGPRRDHAVAGMLAEMVHGRAAHPDLEAATTWVESIADPSLQTHWQKIISAQREGSQP